MSNLFSVTWIDFKSAIVSTIIMAVVSMALYVIGLGDVFQINAKALINIGVISFLTGIVSLLKSYGTDKSGGFMGVVQIKNK